MYKRPDATTQCIIDFLSVRPRRLYELQHEIGQLSAFGVIHKLNTLEIQGIVVAERSPEHKSTIYKLAPASEEKEGSGVDAPLKEDIAECQIKN